MGSNHFWCMWRAGAVLGGPDPADEILELKLVKNFMLSNAVKLSEYTMPWNCCVWRPVRVMMPVHCQNNNNRNMRIRTRPQSNGGRRSGLMITYFLHFACSIYLRIVAEKKDCFLVAFSRIKLPVSKLSNGSRMVEEHNNKFEVLTLPNFPDISLVENLWLSARQTGPEHRRIWTQ